MTRRSTSLLFAATQGTGALVGVSGGYLAARSHGWESDDWRPRVLGAGIGALSGVSDGTYTAIPAPYGAVLEAQELERVHAAVRERAARWDRKDQRMREEVPVVRVWDESDTGRPAQPGW